MKKTSLYFLSILGSFLLLTSCEIVEEIRFNPDGSGKYSLGFDMSEMMKMGFSEDDSTKNQQIDTIINFASFLEEKRDSIKKLDKSEREKLAQLKAYDLYMKVDSVSKQLKMKLGYEFVDIDDMNQFFEKLEDQEIKELDIFKGQLKDKKASTEEKEDKSLDFNKFFVTTFSASLFSRNVSEEALKDAASKKDTLMTKDNPMADLIKFKQRYLFPYKIKKVSNSNARILTDFKGIEIEGNMYEMNNDPKFFDVEVEFENE